MGFEESLRQCGFDIFPCWMRYDERKQKLEKGPAVPEKMSWHEAAKLDAQFLDWSSGVVGLVVPPGVFILDLDMYKGVTPEAVDAALGVPLDWARAHIQNTPSGGAHFAFYCTEEMRQGDSLFKIDGFDSRATNRGFICTGAGYHPNSEGVFKLTYPQGLPTLPPAAVELLKRPEQKDAAQLPDSEPTSDTAQVTEALSHVDPGCSREVWRNIGYALKSLFPDTSEGEAIFEAWSRGDYWPGGEPENYVASGKGSVADQWPSFKTEGGVNASTLFYHAIQSGWRPPRNFDAAAAFGGHGAPAHTFADLVDSIREKAADIVEIPGIVAQIKAANCDALQVALLAAEIKTTLKGAGINDAQVSRTIDGLLASVSPQQQPPPSVGVVPEIGQVLPPDTPLAPSVWVRGHTKGQARKPKATLENFKILLQAYGVHIEFDEIRKNLKIYGPGISDAGVLYEEAALAYLESLANLNEYPTGAIRSMIMSVANDNTVNPVRAMTDAQPWDGADHIGHLWHQITLAPEENPAFCEAVFRRWVRGAYAIGVGAIDRWEHVIVLIDPSGGVGKTRFFATLCPPDLQTDSVVLDTSDKDSVKMAISYWLCELGEIDATFGKTESNRLKAFLSLRRDEMRLPYGRSYLAYPRRTAFWASVNEPQFLVDSSSNRRFWGIRVASVNHTHDVNTQQVWAQAAAEIAAGYEPFLSTEEASELTIRNEMFRTNSAISDALSRLNIVDGSDHYTCTEILALAGVSRVNKRELNEAASWLRRRGFTHCKRSGSWGFSVKIAAPEEASAKAGAFTVIPGGKT